MLMFDRHNKTFIYIYIYIYIYICVCVCVCVCVQVCMCVYTVYACIYVHILFSNNEPIRRAYRLMHLFIYLFIYL